MLSEVRPAEAPSEAPGASRRSASEEAPERRRESRPTRASTQGARPSYARSNSRASKDAGAERRSRLVTPSPATQRPCFARLEGGIDSVQGGRSTYNTLEYTTNYVKHSKAIV